MQVSKENCDTFLYFNCRMIAMCNKIIWIKNKGVREVFISGHNSGIVRASDHCGLWTGLCSISCLCLFICFWYLCVLVRGGWVSL